MYIFDSHYENDLYNQIKINIFKLKEKLNVLYKICLHFIIIFILYNLI